MCFLCLCCSTGDDTAIAPQDPLEERLQEAETLEKPQRDSVYRQLFQEATQTQMDSVRLQRLSALSLKFIRKADSALFRQVNTQAMAEAERQKDTTALAEACWDLAIFLRDYSIPDSAFYHYSKAQRLYQAQGDDFNSGRIYMNMAIVQTDIKDYTGSEITTFRAIRLLQPLEKHKQLYRCYNNLAIGTKFLGEYDRALSYYQKALEHVQQIGEDNSILRLGTLNNIGTVYQEMEDHQAALPYFEEVLQTPKLQTEKPDLYARAMANHAFNRFKVGQNQNVEADLQKALDQRISLGIQGDIAGSYAKLAEYYLVRGDSLKAISNGEKAVQAAKKANNNQRLLGTLTLLAKADGTRAHIYDKEYIRINDSLQIAERKIRDKFARIRFETDEVIAENEALARERQFLTLLSLAAFFLAMAGFIIFRQRIKNQRLRFEQEQQAHNTEIFNLMLQQNQKFEEGKKEEQKRISEELHDGVLGKMLGARMVLTGLNKKQDEGAIAERAGAIESLRAVEVEVRSLSHELSHAAYEKIH
ncbi:MAG: tetratricopeptide repeat protein, partial [Flavobacteriaceae bacterium]